MKRTIDVSTNLSTQVAPDTIDVDITVQGTSKIREDCTAKYNVLLQTIKDALEKNGLPASILKKRKICLVLIRSITIEQQLLN